MNVLEHIAFIAIAHRHRRRRWRAQPPPQPSPSLARSATSAPQQDPPSSPGERDFDPSPRPLSLANPPSNPTRPARTYVKRESQR